MGIFKGLFGVVLRFNYLCVLKKIYYDEQRTKCQEHRFTWL